jgi:hypothetical protein
MFALAIACYFATLGRQRLVTAAGKCCQRVYSNGELLHMPTIATI